MRENTNHRNAFLASKTFQISKIIYLKPFIIYLIFLIFIVIIKENYPVVNENHNLEISMKDEILEIKEVFHQRQEILQRSCQFINKLNTVNRMATISQLKEIHLLLHDLAISRDIISKKLSPYDETKIELDKNQAII